MEPEATHLPVIPINPAVLHAQRMVDFSVEDNLLNHVRKNRWIKLDLGSFRIARFNWVVFASASILLWAFVIAVLSSDKTVTDAKGAESTSNTALIEFKMWRTWITQNFTWLYVGTQVNGTRDSVACIMMPVLAVHEV
jgi:hypothetical protein